MKTHTQLATEAIGFPPSSAPDLHTCPDCHQPGFTTKGLQAHRGNKTCQQRAAQLQPAATAQDPADLRAAEATACITRFRAFHEAAKGSVIALKTAKFVAGIEVQTLCDLHEEEHGETRGRPAAEKSDTPLSLISMEAYLEESLGVTIRTAQRYKRHFLDCSQDHPELADKLRKWWLDWKDKAALELTTGQAAPKKGKATSTQLVTAAPQALALQGVCNLAAKDIETLLHQADEFGLHELFEKPMKDVTPDPEPEPPEEKGDKLRKWWLKDFCRRAMNNEFLKLRKQDKEALLTTLEEATQKLKDSLKK